MMFCNTDPLTVHSLDSNSTFSNWSDSWWFTDKHVADIKFIQLNPRDRTQPQVWWLFFPRRPQGATTSPFQTPQPHKVEMKLFLKYWWGLNQVKDCLVCFCDSSLRHQLLQSNTRLLSLDFLWESFRIVSRTADETVHNFSVSSERQWGQRSRSTLVTLRPASLSRPRLSEEIICSSVTNVCLRSSLLLSGFCSVESAEL